MTTEEERQRNRADVERRYREHLALGPDACPCRMCERGRRARDAAARRVRREAEEHRLGPDCGHPDCLFHALLPPALCPRCGADAGHGPLCGDCAIQSFRPEGSDEP